MKVGWLAARHLISCIQRMDERKLWPKFKTDGAFNRVRGSWKLFFFSRTFSCRSIGSLDTRQLHARTQTHTHAQPYTCTHTCTCRLLCNLCSHHLNESPGMGREKKLGACVIFRLFPTSCFRVFRIMLSWQEIHSHSVIIAVHSWLLRAAAVDAEWNDHAVLGKDAVMNYTVGSNIFLHLADINKEHFLSPVSLVSEWCI